MVFDCLSVLMIDDWLLSLTYAAWMAASTMPMGLMLGAPCSPCCGCGGSKPSTNPQNEGTWTPSGTWNAYGGSGAGVTWSFTSNPGNDSGKTWFFFGSAGTSKAGGGASQNEQEDWGNICNWYSNSTDEMPFVSASDLDKRATTLPPEDAVVHIFSPVSTAGVGSVTVKTAYFWGVSRLLQGSELTATQSAHGTTHGVVFVGVNGSLGGNFGVVNGGALFIYTITDGDRADNQSGGVVNGGATFLGEARNRGTVNDGAEFFDNGINFGGTVNGGATFNDFAANGIAVFPYLTSVVNGGATFNDFARNSADPSAGATGNDFATVNGGAIFNDAACSRRITGTFPFPPLPCTRKFVAHPSDLPTCNGTAPDGCDPARASCGCG